MGHRMRRRHHRFTVEELLLDRADLRLGDKTIRGALGLTRQGLGQILRLSTGALYRRLNRLGHAKRPYRRQPKLLLLFPSDSVTDGKGSTQAGSSTRRPLASGARRRR